jgi:ubiquinone/menaquinone biosynthesis C-methylase UbiE
MDNHTLRSRIWLDKRFKKTDEEGVYYAHEPIYGFRKGHSEPGVTLRYSTTYQIMRALSHVRFGSLLDVGGAEGYTAALARSIFDVKVRSADLSGEACKRAKEIFDVNGEPVDVQQLPYRQDAFDVVVCSETLEHVSDIQGATRELLRVCNKALVITVPREPKQHVENNIKESIVHAHIHSLDINSFRFALPLVSRIISRRFHNPFFKMAAAVVDGMKRQYNKNYAHFWVNVYNSCLPLVRLACGERSARLLLYLDDRISNLVPSYSGMLFLLVKDAGCYFANERKHVSAEQILRFRTPYHYLRNQTD